MTKEKSKLSELPFKSCLLCNARKMEIQRGKRGILRKKPDSILCSGCEAVWFVDEEEQQVKFKELDMPYYIFLHKLHEWNLYKDVKKWGELIRSDDEKVMDLARGFFRHIWRIKLSIGDLDLELDEKVSFLTRFVLSSKNLSSQPASKLKLIQKELRQIKKNLNVDLKDITADYKEQIAKSSSTYKKQALRDGRLKASKPYDDLKNQIDELVLQLDKIIEA